MPGIKTAGEIDGTLNDNIDVHNGWSLEIVIPLKSLQLFADRKSIPSNNGDIWNMFLARFQKIMLSGQEVITDPATTLKRNRIYDTHLTKKWSKIEFAV